MPRKQAGAKSTLAKGRRRKLKEVESEESDSGKRVNFQKDELSCKKQEERLYLSKNAHSHFKMINKMINEFNWNSKEKEIYCRNYEKSEINEYIKQNYEENKSGMMYVLGHPGTGKTSILRIILEEYEQRFQEDKEFKSRFKIFNFNGMVFKNTFDFLIELIKESKMQFYGKVAKNLEAKYKQTDDIVDLSTRIQVLFQKFENVHKLVIIDEVDNLSLMEWAKWLISKNSKTETNTTIIGIANSVELLSKVSHHSSKEGEIVDKKWIFSPYSEREITRIITKKKDKFWKKHSWDYDIIDPKALEFASK